MNLFLHGIDAQIKLGDTIYEAPGRRGFDAILTNPPFGTRGANQAPERDDFTVSTSNKQLNFVQHVLTILRDGGRAAVVLPDNCLFADQAGEVFKLLCEDCELHTVLRLPRGTFTPYSQGVKANVVFFTKGAPTKTVWIYDARTNVPGITKKDRPLTREHFAEFEACYGTDPNGRAKRKPEHSKEDRWRAFDIAEVRDREFKLDGFKWLKEESRRRGRTARTGGTGRGSVGRTEGRARGPRRRVEVARRERGGRRMSTDTELPEGWAACALSEVATSRKGKKPATLSTAQEAGYIPYLDIEAFETGNVRRHADPEGTVVVPPDAILVVWDGARSGYVGLAPVSGALGSTLAHVQPREVDADFLRYFLDSQFSTINGQTRGTGIPHVDPEVFWSLELPLPPVAEQRRIVAAVEAVLAKVRAARERLNRVPAILKRFRQSVLSAACSGRLTADWRAQNPNAEPISDQLARCAQLTANTRSTPRWCRPCSRGLSWFRTSGCSARGRSGGRSFATSGTPTSACCAARSNG